MKPRKTADLVKVEEQGDITVLFDFEKENVNISFISPSGDVYTKSNKDKIMCNEGELWASYRIYNAEPGQWKVKYDLKGNSYINYSLVEAAESICIQSFSAQLKDKSDLNVQFVAELGNAEVKYDYEIGLIDSEGESLIICSDSASSSKQINQTLDLGKVSSGEYTPYLNVYYFNGTVELSDSLNAEKITYQNPDTPDGISDYKVYADLTNCFLKVDWEEYKSGNMDSFMLKVYADDELVSKNSFTDGETSGQISYPVDAKIIRTELYYYDNNLLSDAAVKQIDTENGEYLKLVTGNVTGNAQIELQSRVTERRYALVLVNEAFDENYLSEARADIKNCGEPVEPEDTELYITLEKGGSNTVYAELMGGDNISYIVDASVFYDMYPPQITLYENLNNKTFSGNSVPIIGEVSDCVKLTINGEETELLQNGSFSYDYSLGNGRNTVEIEAVDSNGNASAMTLTLFKNVSSVQTATEEKNHLQDNIYLIASLVMGAVIFVFFIISLRKNREDSKTSVRNLLLISRMISLLVFIAAAFETIRRSLFIRSVKYLELAEQSLSKAADYINFRDSMFITEIIALLVFILLLVIPAVIKRKKNNRNI